MQKNITCWNEYIILAKYIFLDGKSHFEGNDIINEIVNVLLLKFYNKLKYCVGDDVYELFCNKVTDEIFIKYKINLCTKFSVNHVDDLKKLIDLTQKISKDLEFNNELMNALFDNIKQHKIHFIPKNIIEYIVKEISPQNKEQGFIENSISGEFITEIKNHIYGSTHDEFYHKITALNLICNNIDIFKIGFNANTKHNYDYAIGICENDEQIHKFLLKIKSCNKCCIIVQKNVLYNNGTSKQSNFVKIVETTWEYKFRKILLDDCNLYKVIEFENTEFVAIFTNLKNIVERIEFNHSLYITKDDIRKNNYCLLKNMYCEPVKITFEKLKTVDFVQSKISTCVIKNKKHDVLTYRNILHTIYLHINDRKLIKKNTFINIEFGQYTNKGYKYMTELDISIQGTDAKTSLKEIINQCKINKINLFLEIMLDNGSKILITV